VIFLKTISLCPVCLEKIDAEVFEDENRILIEKECPNHGKFRDIYWNDVESYKKYLEYDYLGNGMKNTNVEFKNGCPFDCGLCGNHKSTTILANIDVTNRCNLNCPVCFANANRTKMVYEPSLEEIRKMMVNLRNEDIPCPAIQFAGGEPTVPDDLPEIIKMAKELGFVHVQVATNGIKLKNIEYIKKLKESGLSTIYLQFDGVTEKPYLAARNRNLLPLKLKVIENCEKADFNSVSLVPTLLKGVNHDQIGDILRFAVEHRNVVRNVNFQPVSFTGRIDETKRLEQRITIPDFVHYVEEQTFGEISKEDFYPIPFVVPFSISAEIWENQPVIKLSSHPHCGVATYLFIENGKILPITRFFDVKGFRELLDSTFNEYLGKNGELSHLEKGKVILKISKELPRLIDSKKVPSDVKFKETLVKILKGDRSALSKFHFNTILTSCMHFMDPYNFDSRRVQRCLIHYALPDNRIIPFCTYNTLYRKEIEDKYSIPLEEWKNKH
jgi:hypothetical protein